MNQQNKFERPPSLPGSTTRVRTAHGNLYVVVNTLEGKPVEVFAILGKAGGCDTAYMEGVTRLISITLQGGVSLEEVVRQLRSISCHPYLVGGETENLGPIDAIAQVLESYQLEEKL